MRRLAAETAAKRYVQREFPQCAAAFLAGSAAAGRHHAQSDLDLIVIDGSYAQPFQYNGRRYGWLIESFVMTPATYLTFFDEARKQALPTLIRMCAEGRIVADRDPELAARIQEEARLWMERGPEEWTYADIDRARYEMTDCLDDLEGLQDSGEMDFTVQRLAELLVRFTLRTNGRWAGVGKWAYRELHRFDPMLCGSIRDAVRTFYAERRTEPLIALADQALDAFGGRLREGWIGNGPS